MNKIQKERAHGWQESLCVCPRLEQSEGKRHHEDANCETSDRITLAARNDEVKRETGGARDHKQPGEALGGKERLRLHNVTDV